MTSAVPGTGCSWHSLMIFCKAGKPECSGPCPACAGFLPDVLERQFSEQPRPVLVAALDSAGIETDRFFVTGPDWPDAN
jgi:hypothetical protein